MARLTPAGKIVMAAAFSAATVIGVPVYYFTADDDDYEQAEPVTHESILANVTERIDAEIAELRKPEQLRQECADSEMMLNTLISNAGISGHFNAPYAAPSEGYKYGECELSMGDKKLVRLYYPGQILDTETHQHIAFGITKTLSTEQDLLKLRAALPLILDGLKSPPAPVPALPKP